MRRTHGDRFAVILTALALVAFGQAAVAQSRSPSGPSMTTLPPPSPPPAPATPPRTPAAIGTPAPQVPGIAPLSPQVQPNILSGGGTPRPGGSIALSPGSPSEAAPSTPGGGGKTLSDCMGFWEPATHMSKQEWKAACQRTLNRIQ